MTINTSPQGHIDIEQFIAEWAITGGSELANTQSFLSGLCALLGVLAPTQSPDLK